MEKVEPKNETLKTKKPKTKNKTPIGMPLFTNEAQFAFNNFISLLESTLKNGIIRLK